MAELVGGFGEAVNKENGFFLVTFGEGWYQL